MRIAIAAITFTAMTTVSVAACGNSGRPATASGTPTAAPSPTYDGSTLSACKEADQTGESSDKDFRHAKAARSFAALSDVPALREVAKKYAGTGIDETSDELQALAAAVTISTWCLQHHVAQ